MYGSRLLRPSSFAPLGFMEGGTILSFYLVYLLLNYFIVGLLGVGPELTRLCVFFLLQVLVFSISHHSLARPAIDFYYKAGLLSHMSYLFRGHVRPNYGLRLGVGFIFLLVFFL